MTESLITMSIAGLIVGFVFSIPIAGPMSILITSNALKGRSHYCNIATIGGSIADFIYVFIAVFGLTKLYSLYRPAIPYILLVGMLFLLYTAYKNSKTKVDLEHLEYKQVIKMTKTEGKGAFYSGFMINFLNPTLFIGWLTSSFFMISFVAALGFNTGGLDSIINQNVNQINKFENKKIDDSKAFVNTELNKIRARKIDEQIIDPGKPPKYFHLLISFCYAFFLSVGNIIWFYLLAFLIVKLRNRFNLKIINGVLFSLSIALCFIAVYFGFVAIRMLFTGGK